jgi:hypothetical protein
MKKQYIFPLTEVVNVNASNALLTGSSVTPVDSTLPLPPHPGNPAPKRRTKVF